MSIKLWTLIDGELTSHFSLHEFTVSASSQEKQTLVHTFAQVHYSVLEGLEKVRRDLAVHEGTECWIKITCAVRTEARNKELAEEYGWTDEGGTVARHSKHLPEYRGIAVDLYAYYKATGERVAPKLVGEIARRYFDYVKDTYRDGHIHADQRNHL